MAQAPKSAEAAGPLPRTLSDALPLDGFAAERDPLSPQQIRNWIWLLMALGIAARLLRYGLRLPLWPDEAYLAANCIGQGYRDLLNPLQYHQVCPLLFLCGQLTLVKLFGFSEFSLRLLPLVFSLSGLLIFRYLAGRLLSGTALVLAVGIFAVGYPGLRYAVEAKQYGGELFVSTVLLAVVAQWWRRPDQLRWLWLLAALAPLAVGLSYPVLFLAGGISLASAWWLWTERLHRGWLPWLAWNAAVAGTFLTLYFLSVRNQSGAELEAMRLAWKESFPPLDSAAKFGVWLVSSHSSEMLAHPFGGARGASALTALCCAVALGFLVRRRQWPLLLLVAGTLGLNFAAALLQRYPYAGHIRMALYLGPLVCLLAGLGLARLLARLTQSRAGRFPITAVLCGLAILPVVSMVFDCAMPGKSAGDIRARDFARWFWYEMARDAELVCLKTDEGREFAPGIFDMYFSSLYLCNQKIYSARHAHGLPPQMELVSETHPLRCVLYRGQAYPEDRNALATWLEKMSQRYTLVRQQEYPLTRPDHGHLASEDINSIVVFEFIPKGGRGP